MVELAVPALLAELFQPDLGDPAALGDLRAKLIEELLAQRLALACRAVGLHHGAVAEMRVQDTFDLLVGIAPLQASPLLFAEATLPSPPFCSSVSKKLLRRWRHRRLAPQTLGP